MAKGFIKFVILRLISEGKTTGYAVMKAVGEMSGHKPSSGTIYPLLKTMEKDGWIKGKKSGDKTYYSLTPLGKEHVKGIDKIHGDHIMDLHRSIKLANVTFDNTGDLALMSHDEIMEIIGPLAMEVGHLLNRKVDKKKIDKVLTKAKKALEELR